MDGFDGDGYLALVVLYSCGTVSNFVAPSVQSFFGLRMSMTLASVFYAAYQATFFKLSNALLYAGAAIVGLGGGPLWVSQGAFLSRNSDDDTAARNSGLFLVMFQGSGIVGNTFAYYYFRDSHEIDERTRNIFNGTLLCVSMAGTLVFFFMRETPVVDEKGSGGGSGGRKREDRPDPPLVAIRRTVELWLSPDVALLSVYFVYTGMTYAFTSGVYGPSLSFTRNFEDGAASNGLAGLHGILVNTSHVVAGLSFALYGHALNRRLGRLPVVAVAVALEAGGYAVAALNLPGSVPQGPTSAEAAVSPSSLPLALAGSVLLGLADGTLNAQACQQY